MILHLPAMPNQRYKFETVEFADSINAEETCFISAAKTPSPPWEPSLTSRSNCALPIFIGLSSAVFISYFFSNMESQLDSIRSFMASSRISLKYLNFPPCLVNKLFARVRFPSSQVEPLWVFQDRTYSVIQILEVLLNIGQDLEQLLFGLDKLLVLGRGDSLQDAFVGLIERRGVAERCQDVTKVRNGEKGRPGASRGSE